MRALRLRRAEDRAGGATMAVPNGALRIERTSCECGVESKISGQDHSIRPFEAVFHWIRVGVVLRLGCSAVQKWAEAR